MAKTNLTTELEYAIYRATKKQGIYACFEVTIGIGGDERVDYMTLDSKGIYRCYEVKVSVSDFRSKAKKSFYGHFNYYVMTQELYDKVKDEIPKHIGIYIGAYSVKKAKRQELTISEEVLRNSLIRSLSREADKMYRSGNVSEVDNMRRLINRYKREKETTFKELADIRHKLYKKFGRKWQDVIEE